jgi:hypothetical protein
MSESGQRCSLMSSGEKAAANIWEISPRIGGFSCRSFIQQQEKSGFPRFLWFGTLPADQLAWPPEGPGPGSGRI